MPEPAALVFALNPTWTPGQVKSALGTTAKTAVKKPDRVTQADPFDYGSGRIDLTKAGDPGLTMDETAANYAASATDALNRIDLNLPSVNAPTMPGLITAERTVKNVTNQTLTFTATGTTVSGANITVLPPLFQVKPGKTQKLTIAITAPDLPDGQYFGQVNLKQVGGSRALHLPVAFFRQEGIVPVDQTCTPSTIARNTGQSTCTVTVQNNSLQSTQVTAAQHAELAAAAEQRHRRDQGRLPDRDQDRDARRAAAGQAGHRPGRVTSGYVLRSTRSAPADRRSGTSRR